MDKIKGCKNREFFMSFKYILITGIWKNTKYKNRILPDQELLTLQDLQY